MQCTESNVELQLRRLSADHLAELVASAQELAQLPQAPWWATEAYSEVDAKRYLDRADAKQASARGEVFGVVRAGRLIGCCALDDVDWVHGHAAIWLWLRPTADYLKAATQALDALCQIANSRGLTQLEALAPVTDKPWLRVLEARGAVTAAVIPRRFLLHGLRVDARLTTLQP